VTQKPPLDPEAKRAEFERTALPLLGTLYQAAVRLTSGVVDASDLVQETYLRAYRTFENFRLGTNCKAWLFTIMHSVFVNQYRRTRRVSEVSVADLELRFQRFLESPLKGDEEITTVEGWGRRWDPEVKEALALLPDDFRTPLLLVDAEGLSYEEASAVLGCPVGTVGSRVHRARKLLFAGLSDYARREGYRSDDR